MASRFEERLGRMIEAANEASGSPYAVLEGEPFSLSTSVARTIVVGSGLSKSDSAVREREAKRIAKWREQGHFGPVKSKTKPAAKAEPKVKTDDPIVVPGDAPITATDEDAVAPERASKPKPTRRRTKDGQASGTAKAIARNRSGSGRSRES